jgi:succinyl-CoA synthetase beta subunit
LEAVTGVQTCALPILSITIDRIEQSYLLLASANGGVDIEEAANKTDKTIIKKWINPQEDFFHDATAVAEELGYKGAQMTELANIISKLYLTAIENDTELAEINPLAELTDKGFVALDAHITIDDNALFRHPEFNAILTEREKTLTSLESYALKNDLAYVKLGGDIGVIANGAGLEMATLDLISYYGGKPANFLDLGGGTTIQRINAALQVVLEDPNTKAVLVNILGGITRCDEVAKSIVESSKTSTNKKPIVVRLSGTNELKGKMILSSAGIHSLDSMEEAAKQAVETVKRMIEYGNN